MIINTKKGQLGQPRINVGISTGVSAILKKIKVLNATQYREAIKYYNASPLNDKGSDVDALDAILQNGLQQNYTMAVSGGNEYGKYRVSANLLNQDGIIINTGFKKYGVGVSTSFKFLENKRLGLDININSSQYIQDVPSPAGGASGLIQYALQWNPTDSLKNPDGSVKITPGSNVNPLALSKFTRDNLKVTTLLGNISPYYKFSDRLEYKLLVSINYSSGISRFSVNQVLNAYTFFPQAGFAGIKNYELITEQITNTLNFNKDQVI